MGGEMSPSMEEPNIHQGDGDDDDGVDVEDGGVKQCKSDPWRTNFSMDGVSKTLNEIR